MDNYEEEDLEDIFQWKGRILVCANLNYNVRPCDLRELFAPKGKLLRVDIEKDHSGNSNGLGFVEFASPADCEAATELNLTQFQGRILKCKISEKPPPELIRFYIRRPEKRPINEGVRQRIIDEARNGPREMTEAPNRPHTFPHRKKTFQKRRNSDSDYSSSYGSYSYSSSESDSGSNEEKHKKSHHRK